jgi:cytidylate kinase
VAREARSGFVVAIDGPAGAGKSSVSKTVALRAGLSLVDTGAIYRSVALLAQKQGVDLDDADKLAAIALALPIRFEMRGDVNHVLLDDAAFPTRDVTHDIRTPAISTASSQVSRHPPVRAALLDLQRRLGDDPRGALLEGRDIGTVVFPEAAVKIFLTASPEERARRRQRELAEKGAHMTLEAVLQEIGARDDADSTRDVAPLRAAPDATQVDTSGLELEDVVARILTLIDEARAKRLSAESSGNA